MELVLEILSSKQFVPTDLCQKTFSESGGVIGRGADCDWVIPDRKRHLSSRHALISCRDNEFFLTDISSNGIQDCTTGAQVLKNEAILIETGSVYLLGDFEIRARLSCSATAFDTRAGGRRMTGNIIPDEVFLDFDPLSAVDQQQPLACEIDAFTALGSATQEPMQCADFARIDMENMLVPQLIDAPQESAPAASHTAAERPSEDFWARFGTALGMELDGLETDAREALAVSAARLLKQSISGLQQSLRTRSELKNELRLAQTTVQGLNSNPLKYGADTADVLGMLLANRPGQLPADQAISRAFRDLQAHQVALLAASRAAVRGAVEHFSPQQLTLRFERENPSLLGTSGNHWKAYGRYHQALLQDGEWGERLLARDFAQAYEEQIRLISTLHTDLQG
jgi:type VI secretion system protein ImpI